jgi:hypothetical protein
MNLLHQRWAGNQSPIEVTVPGGLASGTAALVWLPMQDN